MESVPYDPDRLIEGVRRMAATLRGRGIRVVLVAAPPAPHFDAGMCHAAAASGKWMPLRSHCEVDLAERAEDRRQLATLLSRFEREAGVPVFRFEPWLCRDGRCAGAYGGKPLFYDKGHFSAPAFARLAADIGLARRLEEMAR